MAKAIPAQVINELVGGLLESCGLKHRKPLFQPPFPAGAGWWDRVLDADKAISTLAGMEASYRRGSPVNGRFVTLEDLMKAKVEAEKFNMRRAMDDGERLFRDFSERPRPYPDGTGFRGTIRYGTPHGDPAPKGELSQSAKDILFETLMHRMRPPESK